MSDTAPYVLFRDDSENRTTVFASPSRVITARTKAEFVRGLAELERAHISGKWIAGFMSYEAGHLFEEKLEGFAEEHRETPLMSFGIFDAPSEDHPLAEPQRRTENEPFLSEPRAGWDFETYRERFDRLHQHLRQGDCYQANLTMPIRARWSCDPLSSFFALIDRQPVKYGERVALDGPVLRSRAP